jgi:HlyD family type I secretion membrane fusion protein
MTIPFPDKRDDGVRDRGRSGGAASRRPDIRRPVLWGAAVLFVFVGGFGGWAALAPLSSAAVASGHAVIDSERKTVQHLEGGIVDRILVREGEQVTAGQPLVRLDTTQALATWNIESGKLTAERALAARLVAERDGRGNIDFSPALEQAARTDAATRAVLDGQETIFMTRRQALDGQRQILTERTGQLRSQIEGLRAQEEAAREQLVLIEEEVADVRGLVEKGLERQSRLRGLEREVAGLNGQLGQLDSDIAKAEQGIGETRLQIIDLDNRRAEEVVRELRETETRIADLLERVRAAEDVLARRDILAPVEGSVVNLHTVTRGGVVAPGDTLMEIVPEEDKLNIQVQVRPTDIDRVHAGLPAKVDLTAFKTWMTPRLDGELVYVSADSLYDQQDETEYYDARIEVDRHELERYDDVHLYPGMPVRAMVVTGERTLLEYLVQPVLDSFTVAFRED